MEKCLLVAKFPILIRNVKSQYLGLVVWIPSFGDHFLAGRIRTDANIFERH
jgi:hypothetical protein